MKKKNARKKKSKHKNHMQKIKTSHLILGGIFIILFVLFVPPKGTDKLMISIYINDPIESVPLVVVICVFFPLIIIANWFTNRRTK